jgi:hypothetical protein
MATVVAALVVLALASSSAARSGLVGAVRATQGRIVNFVKRGDSGR